MADEKVEERELGITWAQLSKRISIAMREKSEWAGVPIPLDGFELTLEPRFPYQYQRTCRNEDIDESVDSGIDEVNLWWSRRLQANILVYHERGRAKALVLKFNRFAHLAKTIGVSIVWPLDAELKAREKLYSLIGDHKARQYELTGAFLETSPRSKVTYVFRRGRPTLAVRPNDSGGTRVIAGLCQHVIGYYLDTWAGCMVPTDEVVAALTLMRGDEHYFWKCCNQHPADDPLCGL